MLAQDFQIFLLGYAEFFRQCGHCFVLMKDGNVLNVYDADKTTYSHALSDALINNELGTFLLKEVSGTEEEFAEYEKTFQRFLAPVLMNNENR